METAAIIRTARHRGGFTLRALGRAAGTSHSAIAAYESGAKTPSTATLDRIVRAAGYALDRSLHRRVDGENRGRELTAVLELAAEFPARHSATLDCPVFGR